MQFFLSLPLQYPIKMLFSETTWNKVLFVPIPSNVTPSSLVPISSLFGAPFPPTRGITNNHFGFQFILPILILQKQADTHVLSHISFFLTQKTIYYTLVFYFCHLTVYYLRNTPYLLIQTILILSFSTQPHYSIEWIYHILITFLCMDI